MRDHTYSQPADTGHLPRHTAFERPLTREELVAWHRRARTRSRALFQIPVEDAWYDRPIPLRNPIVFYEGHLPAFAVNTLVKLARNERGIDPRLESLFEQGIDPEDETAVRDPAETWPAREEVQAYARAADAMIERALLELGDEPVQIEAAANIIEHEFMHQETLLYMFHNMPYERKRRPAASSPTPAAAGRDRGAPKVVRIPRGRATLGGDPSHFGWDNEFPQHVVHVDAFEIDCFNVSNGDYLEFMDATGAASPHFWVRDEGKWFWRGMFEPVALPLDWPVYATHEEAEAYARWRGRRLPSEAEYHRAAFGTPSGEERRFPWGDERPDPTRGNFDFASWDPRPAGSWPAGASAWGVHDLVGNGWEWTSTIFDGFRGFQPMATYRRYSANFFDGQHYVIKGASPATARELIRGSFRNWFRPNYPYVYATFRCAR
ncbi:MAG TPA: SUMF1/EgtB/PvdO family nonheme iron enzyme [Thermoanaerobaculia bacterium]|nr:SUMF1/EgtB/PvdO family nonheme iron enzyme [Thermoanaerobaculia bacterium]